MQISLYTRQQSLFEGLLLLCSNFFKTFLLVLLILPVYGAYGADMDLDKLLLKAKKQNKHIMLFHHIPKCPYCETMLKENFKDKKILNEIGKNFIYVDIYTLRKGSINFQGFKGSYKEFSEHIGVFVYPSTLFMNNKGKVVYSSVGYRNIDEYFLEIKYVSSESYKTMDLDTYIEKKEMEEF